MPTGQVKLPGGGLGVADKGSGGAQAVLVEYVASRLLAQLVQALRPVG